MSITRTSSHGLVTLIEDVRNRLGFSLAHPPRAHARIPHLTARKGWVGSLMAESITANRAR